MKIKMKKNGKNICAKVFIFHQYGASSHFRALYDCGGLYGFDIQELGILDIVKIYRNFAKTFLKKRHPILALYNLLKELKAHYKLFFISNEIVVVGLAPYDTLMLKYAKYFKRNKSFYYTSATDWDGIKFARGSFKNKGKFEEILSTCMVGAFCVNQKAADEMAKFIKEIAVVNHSILVSEYKQKKKESYNAGCPQFVYLGQIIERKNINLIIKWITNNKDKIFELSFIGGGDFQYVRKVTRLSKKDKRIRYLGTWENQEIKDRLCEFDFLLLPSKEEPFGIVLLEAFAAGLVCVASDAVGPSEVINDQENGFIFKLEDEEKNFNHTMETCFLLDKERFGAISLNAAETARQYNVGEIIKKWICLLPKLNGAGENGHE